MKIFREENGKEVVYIQCKDLNLITSVEPLCRYIDIDISISQSLATNREKFVKLEEPKIIAELKKLYFIVDFDEFKSLSEEEINKRFKENEQEIETLSSKKVRKDERLTIMHIYKTKAHYAEDMRLCYSYRKNNEEPEYNMKI